jgi:hypothetical protein
METKKMTKEDVINLCKEQDMITAYEEIKGEYKTIRLFLEDDTLVAYIDYKINIDSFNGEFNIISGIDVKKDEIIRFKNNLTILKKILNYDNTKILDITKKLLESIS